MSLCNGSIAPLFPRSSLNSSTPLNVLDLFTPFLCLLPWLTTGALFVWESGMEAYGAGVCACVCFCVCTPMILRPVSCFRAAHLDARPRVVSKKTLRQKSRAKMLSSPLDGHHGLARCQCCCDGQYEGGASPPSSRDRRFVPEPRD